MRQRWLRERFELAQQFPLSFGNLDLKPAGWGDLLGRFRQDIDRAAVSWWQPARGHSAGARDVGLR